MFKRLKELKAYLIPVVILIFVVISSSFGMWDEFEYEIYDSFYVFRGSRVPGGNVVIVAIDDASVKELGPFERWDRSVHARLIRRLEKASVVGFDVIFDSRTSLESDSEVAAAIAGHGGVVLGCEIVFRNKDGAVYSKMQVPISDYAMGCHSLGFVNFPTDPDNVTRRSTLVSGKPGGKLFPSLGLAAVLTAKGLTPDALEYKAGNILSMGGLKIPLDNDNRLLINFWGTSGTFKTYSYISVLRGEYAPEEFSGKIVLIGASAAAVHDYFQTPFTKGNLVLTGALPNPGVELHASAVETILSGSWLQRAGAAANAALILFAGLLTAFGAVRHGPLAGFLTVLGVTIMVLLVSYLSWDQLRYWLNTAAPLSAVLLVYTCVTAQNFLRSEAERRKTRALFSRYVNKELVDYILLNPDLVAIGGQQRDVTVLFIDMRGFTNLSYQKAPEEIFLLINRHLSLMTEIILKYGGMLDKYTGDGLMAVFGTPVPQSDHARRAVLAAVEIMKGVDEMNIQCSARGETQVKIGMGISSGSVLAGNVGSPERMDYTVIGEDVNLASRLEQLTKELGVTLLIGENTVKMLDPADGGAEFGLENLGLVEVRGFQRPVQVYTVGCSTNQVLIDK